MHPRTRCPPSPRVPPARPQEYRERLQLAEAPLVSPPLVPVQRALIDAYASQSEATWTEWMTNLHESDVELLKKGELEEHGGTIHMSSSPGQGCQVLITLPLEASTS